MTTIFTNIANFLGSPIPLVLIFIFLIIFLVSYTFIFFD